MENPLHRSWVFRMGVTLGVLLVAIIPVNADIVTVPPDLNLGDQYRLIFVTTTTTNALDGRIDYYDEFVTNNANDTSFGDALPTLGVSWTAIVSTNGYGWTWIPHDTNQEAVAKWHTETWETASNNYPIYNLQGTLVATDNSDLWSKDGGGSHVVGVNRAGSDVETAVWTGSTIGGFEDCDLTAIDPYDNRLGCDDDCTFNFFEYGTIVEVARTGIAHGSGYDWIHSGLAVKTAEYPVYAISSPITVVPVPPAIWLLGSGLLALFGIRRRGRKA